MFEQTGPILSKEQQEALEKAIARARKKAKAKRTPRDLKLLKLDGKCKKLQRHLKALLAKTDKPFL